MADVGLHTWSCGATTDSNGLVTWRVWAPRAKSVELELHATDGKRHRIPMQAELHAYFTHTQRDIREGQLYTYRLDGQHGLPDPASRWQPNGVCEPSAVLFPDRFDWSEGDWHGIDRAALVIYELHVGTFTREGTFGAIIPRLSTLRELGITAIELMPIAQFPGERNWGYDGVHPFAVQNSYGGPHGLERLVNACHQQSLAVILDVVYNHVGPEGSYFEQFGPYFTDRYRTPWGRALNFDDSGCDAVRSFVLENVRHWIQNYRVDGLRLDAVHAIFDSGPRHILAEIKVVADQESRRLGRPVHVIAESNLNDVRLLNPPERGGYGLDAQWSDDFHHCVHTLLTGESNGYYADFGRPEQLAKALKETFVYDGCYSIYRGRRHGAVAGDHAGDRFVVSVQTHDQVGNRATGDRFGTLLSPAQQRLSAGLLLLAPHLPLLFMGEEYGETRPFPFFCSFQDDHLIEAVRAGRRAEFASFGWKDEIPDPQDPSTFASAKLSWSWAEGSVNAGLRRLYHDLLAARRHWPALRDFRNRAAEFVGENSSRVLRLVRGGDRPDAPGAIISYFNLTDQPQRVPTVELPGFFLLSSSELSGYGGVRPNEKTLHQPFPLGDAHWLLAYEFQVFGPKPSEAP